MIQPIEKVLVANRGEIARRILRTCRSLGIRTVAVFSDADASMPFVREADEAVRIGPPPSAESYLRVDAILDAARRTGADAIHPGYGFLAENAAFAEACGAAGVIFIGPTPAAIRAMGLKREAKALVAKAGVPVVPGYDGEDQDEAVLARKAKEVGYPVLLKASAGGGGKGMKLVRSDAELADAIASAKREAASAFGDATLLVEKYVDQPRHVEIQILGDAHGNLVHLHERECSIQRRHQKIIEEAPSPVLDEAHRRRMGEAAVACGKAIGYRNAGTVEFILAPGGQFYFLEVNTRLQVEHPVTECITGLDLVAEQIRVAEGRPLRFAQESIPLRGAAVEVRIYAEDPASGFLPQIGRVSDFTFPAMEGLRVDAGVETGSEVGIHYDPMLAKVITWGDDRLEALRRMRRALSGASIHGVVTNRDFLLRVLAHPEFVAGRFDTHFIQNHLADALDPPVDREAVEEAALAAVLADHETQARERTWLPGVPAGFRNNPTEDAFVELAFRDRVVRLEYLHLGGGRFRVGGDEEGLVELVTWDGAEVIWERRGHRQRTRVVSDGERRSVVTGRGSFELHVLPRFPERVPEVVPGGCIAPMPGKVVQIRVTIGERVTAGQTLLVMEAMKMEHTVTAPHEGVVELLHVEVGEQVDAEYLLAVVTPDGGED